MNATAVTKTPVQDLTDQEYQEQFESPKGDTSVKQIIEFQRWIKIISDQYQMKGDTDKERSLVRQFCMIIGAWEESIEADLAKEELTDFSGNAGGDSDDPERNTYLVELSDFLNYVVQIHRELDCSFDDWDDFDELVDSFSGMPDGDLEGITKRAHLDLAGTIKRVFRNDPGQEQYRKDLNHYIKRAVAVTVANGAVEGFTLIDIIIANQIKLNQRRKAKTLTGRGDKR